MAIHGQLAAYEVGQRYPAVLTAGLPRLEEVLDRAAAGSRFVSGEEAFKLYDSLGVPLDFTPNWTA